MIALRYRQAIPDQELYASAHALVKLCEDKE